MPATEDVWRNLRTMHVVFAVSSIALFGATWLMMDRDYADEWRPLQRTNFRLQADQLLAEKATIENPSFLEDEQKIEDRLAAAEQEVEDRQAEIDEAKDAVDPLEGEFQLLTRQVKDERARLDKARADLDIAVRDGSLSTDALRPYQDPFNEQKSKVEAMQLELQRLEAKLDEAKEKLTALTKVRDDALAARKKHETDLARVQKSLAQIQPTGRAEQFKRWLMELPIIEGFNGPLKIDQIWLPDLKVGLGGMTEVARFDRCGTCHANIDRVGTGNVPSFPYDPHGITMANADEYLESNPPKKRVHEDGTPVGYGHPFSTHPRPELYLTSSSPHPKQKFGCTACHDGQGSGTSFQNASHTPSAPDIAEEWRRKYGYVSNHFWEYPMFPKRLAEAACVKCHHGIVELGVHPQHGASAPKLYRGYELIRQYGCFGCHEINGYNAGRAIGPDMRLEPQTPEEAERIAADPTAVAGTMRKVGPGLRHFASKTNKAWAEHWVEEPKRFRPETRMPQFFDLSNQKDPHARELQPVEIAGIVAFLFEKSEPLQLDEWAADYVPDAERGKTLFSQRGCLACHSHNDFPGIEADFGPNLTNVHQKLSNIKWLYTWIREPTRHSARTKMPNLFVEPETIQDKTIDPAADIAAFLLSSRDAEGKLVTNESGQPVRDDVGPGRFQPLEWKPSALNELVELYLNKVLKRDQVEEALASNTYPAEDAEKVRSAGTKPDEIELVDGPITDESKLRYIGRRTISRYGCYGCHDIPGYEKARPIGTALQDWGRKDPTKLALEHIEEYLHHFGEPDGSSTAERAERELHDGLYGNFTPEEYERESSAAFFYSQLISHGRAGFLWQKLRDPRSYDYKKTETKGWDERLRMPKFPVSEDDIEAIATFVLGLVAEPPAEKYLYRPQGAAKARIQGEKLISKYNCAGCHSLELPEMIGVPEDLTPDEMTPSDYPEALQLLLKLKPPRDARTNLKLPSGEPTIGFHGMVYQPPDPEDDPEDRSYFFTNWETLHLGKTDELFLPGRRMEVKVGKLLDLKPGRGGAFADWLADHSRKANRELNPDQRREMVPPTLYREGVKVQTPWLYRFLKNPERIRYTTVLRMPQFNMSNEEAQALADYFAAVDGAAFPYQDVPQREPDYLSRKEQEHPGYLKDAWKLLTMPPPTGVCNGCHAVGGLEFVGGGDPTKVTHAPNLEGVYNRLRPDYLGLWLYKPTWITPYTSMPQNFPAEKEQFPELFAGKGAVQVPAARDALMNYLRLLEREGKATAVARPTPPADAPAPEESTND